MIGTQFGAVALFRVTALQQAHATPADSVVVESPLPGGVGAVARFLLNTVPPWVQIGGLVLAVVVGAAVLWHLLRRREAIRTWLTSRARGVQVALAGVTVLLIAGVIGMSAATWNYTQHSNDFCVACHVMNPAFQKFGNAENKHAELGCHDCHQQPLAASVRQLYLWIAERPEKIGEHAGVPDRVCETCHVTGDTATWQRVAATAGHRVHLESDSSALRDLQCITCHGVEVHRFRPATETCGQSGCHEPAETDIVLGKMATQTVRHCTSCHAFTADVPALATRDSAAGTLVPGMGECLGCHEMRRVLADFDEAKDPHAGKCGTCHNPHEQDTPQAAAATCATAGCHGDWRNEPFHVNAAHRRVGEQCTTCHVPHSAKVDASDCAGCHTAVRSRGRLRPPLPFDTAAALRRTASIGDRTSGFGLRQPRVAHFTATGVRGWANPDLRAPSSGSPTPGSGNPGSRSSNAELRATSAGAHGPWFSADFSAHAVPVEWPPPAPPDTFTHARHAKLACLVCHETGAGHGRLTFEPPRGCAICHHQAPASSRCASCHRTAEYASPRPVTVTVTVPGRQPNTRPVDFLHAQHQARACTECHTTPVTLAPPPAKAQCQDCHTEHHAAGRECSACHKLADPKAAHTTLEVAHQRCDACHTATTVARLTPTRSFCSTCHAAKARDHYDRRECAVCHFLTEPDAHRARLTSRPRG